jgi:hypothetical protein
MPTHFGDDFEAREKFDKGAPRTLVSHAFATGDFTGDGWSDDQTGPGIRK